MVVRQTMSRYGLLVVTARDSAWPACDSQGDAERLWFAQRDFNLNTLHTWSVASGRFNVDETPESLKTVEEWYFDAASQEGLPATPAVVHMLLGFYFGQVLVSSAKFTWVVRESAFVPGHYGIGVTKGLVTIMLSDGMPPDPPERNKRRLSLYRQYKKWAA
jgi:hypothetical protein